MFQKALAPSILSRTIHGGMPWTEGTADAPPAVAGAQFKFCGAMHSPIVFSTPNSQRA